MDHPVAVSAKQDKFDQLGFCLARCMQRQGVVDFDVLATPFAVERLEIKPTYFAVDARMFLEEVSNLLAPQASVALPDEVPPLKQASFGRLVVLLVYRHDKLLGNVVLGDRSPQFLGDAVHVGRIIKELLKYFLVNCAALCLPAGVRGMVGSDIDCLPGDSVCVAERVTPDLDRVGTVVVAGELIAQRLAGLRPSRISNHSSRRGHTRG